MDEVVSVEGLCKRYKLPKIGKEVVALDKVSFKIGKGEVLGVIGKSGAGKTTLLRMLRGYEKFDEGVIKMGGGNGGTEIKVVPDSPYSEFRKLQKMTAFHLQRSFALWNLSVVNNIIMRLRAVQTGAEEVPQIEDEYEELKEQAMEILDLVGLREKYNYFYPILSGGEKQRVLLARQLAKSPSVLLLDEPSTMSDPLSREEMLESVKRVKERTEVSVLVVSHMPEVHRYLSDRLIWMEGGRIIEDGGVEEIIGKFLAELEPVKPLTPVRDKRDTMIEINRVWKKYVIYTSNTLIKTIEMPNLNLKIPRGDILGVIGPSAMGKTVLMRMLAGIEQPDKGFVLYRIGTVDFANIAAIGSRRAMEARSRLGVLHQEFTLPPFQLVQDAFAQKLGIKKLEMVRQAMARAKEHGISDVTLDALLRIADMPELEAKEKLEELGVSIEIFDELFPKFPPSEAFKAAKPFLKALDLPKEIFERHNSEASAGEHVRLAIAILMAANSEVLLLDEPFGDLDPISMRKVANSIKELNREFNTTILVVSHQLDVVRELTHEAIMIDEGEIVMRGDPNEVCDAFIALGKPEE
ncbi:MAG: ATP-binding cassette domain-containing protein [Methanophagales archaeon]|nr:ATP-binding cassette domain-containing protein [Methanophagales archaeon]